MAGSADAFTGLHLVRGFGSATAVCDVTCVVPAGARIAVTGPSGSGKSTLLHLIAGIGEPRHLAGFVAAEAAVVTVPALLLGAALGAGLAQILVTTLSGVFDPPPDSPAVPWRYLAGVVAAIAGAVTLTVTILVLRTRRPDLTLIRSE